MYEQSSQVKMYLVRSQAPQYYHSLELSQFLVPRHGQWCIMGLLLIIVTTPITYVGLKLPPEIYNIQYSSEISSHSVHVCRPPLLETEHNIHTISVYNKHYQYMYMYMYMYMYIHVHVHIFSFILLMVDCSPLKAFRSHMRQSSSHDLSESHCGAGFLSLFSSPTPPVRKNMNSLRSSSCLALQQEVHVHV